MSFQEQIAAKLGTLKKGFVLYQHESRTDPETGFPLLISFPPKWMPLNLDGSRLNRFSNLSLKRPKR